MTVVHHLRGRVISRQDFSAGDGWQVAGRRVAGQAVKNLKK